MTAWPARRVGVFFRVDSVPPIRLWAGVGERRLPLDAVENDPGNLYSGAGELSGFPALNQLINGVAQRVDFTLSGTAVTAEAVSIADGEADTVEGVAVHVGIRRYGADDMGVGPTVWLWEGIADTVTLTSTEAAAGQQLRSIGLGVGTVMTFRRRSRNVLWTGKDQRRRSADDAMCDRVNRYSAESTKAWWTY